MDDKESPKLHELTGLELRLPKTSLAKFVSDAESSAACDLATALVVAKVLGLENLAMPKLLPATFVHQRDCQNVLAGKPNLVLVTLPS